MISAEVVLSVQKNCGTVVANYIRSMAMNSYSLQPIAISAPGITTLNMNDNFVESTTQVINNIYDADFDALDESTAVASVQISDRQKLLVFEFSGTNEIVFGESRLATLLSHASLKIVFLYSCGVNTTVANKQILDEFKSNLGIQENTVEFSSRHNPVQLFTYEIDSSDESEDVERLKIVYKCTTEIIDQMIVDLDSIKNVRFLSKKP